MRRSRLAVWVSWCVGGTLLGWAEGASISWGERLFATREFARRDAGVSCMTCHVAGQGDGTARSPLPVRPDGRGVTVRNSPTLVDALVAPDNATLLHYDGEFESAEALVKETLLGRNFGWLPHERDEAMRQFASVARRMDGAEAWREAADETVVDAASRALVRFLRTMRFSRDADGLHDGSAYDAFLLANRLPRAPMPGQSVAEYGPKLGEQAAALRALRFVDGPGGAGKFGELELRGMRIFFRGAIGLTQTSGAGNCAECHVPPHFTDFKFHNTGSAQDEYDAMHGVGAFMRLEVPNLAQRNAELERWLSPSRMRPRATGPWFWPTAKDAPGRTDLGVWNVYANQDMPGPQAALERTLNPAGTRSKAEVLELSLARFKTTTVRNLGVTAPYLHTGHLGTIEEVIEFYRRMSDLAREGKMRNAPPEYFGMRLAAEDTVPLAAFLRALEETR